MAWLCALWQHFVDLESDFYFSICVGLFEVNWIYIIIKIQSAIATCTRMFNSLGLAVHFAIVVIMTFTAKKCNKFMQRVNY